MARLNVTCTLLMLALMSSFHIVRAQVTPAVPVLIASDMDGAAVMAEHLRRHEQFPYVYEQQTMVLVDSAGKRQVRRVRRYMRVESDLAVKFLMVFMEPSEIRGVALLALRDPKGNTRNMVYLPAFGGQLKQPAGDGRTGAFLGTDFAVEDLTAEVPGEFDYARKGIRHREGVDYFVIDAIPKPGTLGRTTSYGRRQHLVRTDNFLIVRTDFYDRNARFIKRLTYHNLRRVYGESWRANMLVMDHYRDAHRTLVKVEQRVYSRDYVPQKLFEPEYLLANRHVFGAATGPVEDVEH
jgi:hypothetical protein